jgi:methionyl-tRNA formyltransferase
VTPPRLLFAGTPEFARASLAALVDSGARPVAVLTQPDRPSGRGRKLTPGPVKAYALEHGLEVRQPRTLRDDDAVAMLRDFEPDLLVVAAYGLILPQSVLDVPRLGCLNVHASLLPRWRGAAPIQAAVLNGDAVTGISLMQMEAGLDTGPVFATAELAIGERETAGELHDRLAALGGKLLVERLDDIVLGRLEAIPQDDAQSTYAGKITREDAEIDWSQPAVAIDRQVRAFNPVPGAWTEALGEPVKIWLAKPVAGADAEPGTVVAAGRDGLVVACGKGCLAIESLQRPGRGRVTGTEFAGQRELANARFGRP